MAEKSRKGVLSDENARLHANRADGDLYWAYDPVSGPAHEFHDAHRQEPHSRGALQVQCFN